MLSKDPTVTLDPPPSLQHEHEQQYHQRQRQQQQQQHHHQHPRHSIRQHILRFAGAAAILYGALVVLGWLSPHLNIRPCHAKAATPLSGIARRVPLEAHVMSKCPDARDCLRDLILPVMANVSDKVDFTISYIGSRDKNGVVHCKHGQEECLGNTIELCAADLYPSPKTYLGFIMCLSNDYSAVPNQDLVRDCALEHDLEIDKLNECLTRDEGAYALGLLSSSVDRSQAANVTYSCTVRLNNETRCIRDDGEWKDCSAGSKPEDLIKDIKKLQVA